MSRNRCTQCGTSHPKWSGRCPSCAAWNTLVEEAPPGRNGRTTAVATARPITEIVAGEGALVDYTKVQQESDAASHYARVQVHQGRSSSVATPGIRSDMPVPRLSNRIKRQNALIR